MKLETFRDAGPTPSVGALMDDGETVSDLTASGAAYCADMLALIDGGDAALDEARRLTAVYPRHGAATTLRFSAEAPMRSRAR